MQDRQKDFFISYNRADRAWAEWIAWQLEEAKYSTIVQAWDFQPGSNFVLEMHEATKRAKRIIAVLSPDYLKANFTQSEWTEAFRRDPKGEQGILVPVRVHHCEVEGLLGPIVYIDLIELDEVAASEKLLAGVRRERSKPIIAPNFPGKVQHLEHERPRFPGVLSHIWNVPHRRNSLFTGREEIINRLYNTLTTDRTASLTQPRAISGLGGIGKTQTAVEYAYRYQSNYQAVLWAKADSREAIISDFAIIANLLNLTEKNEQDQTLVVEAVKQWLRTHTDWLLIIDNADDPTIVRDFLPLGGMGHILLTTRTQAMGKIAQGIELEKMAPQEGSLFLLRRAGILGSDSALDKASATDRAESIEIVQAMDGLPLALDQAGAYIEETKWTLSEYLHLYRRRQVELLKMRGRFATDHPEPVATTWSLSFEKVQKVNPAAVDLLQLCAFLYPDSIPEEIIIKGAPDLGSILRPIAADPIKLNKAIGELLTYSLAACRRERTGSHASRSASVCVVHGTGTSARTAGGRRQKRVSDSDPTNWKDVPIPMLRPG